MTSASRAAKIPWEPTPARRNQGATGSTPGAPAPDSAAGERRPRGSARRSRLSARIRSRPPHRVALILLALGGTALAAPAVPWHQSLYLANGGYWPQRVAVTVTNTSATPAVGTPLSIALPPLAGASLASVRVCRADGVELLFDALAPGGAAKRAGILRPEDKIVVPVECPAHAATTLFVYAGNPVAWAVPDFLPSEPAHSPPDARRPALKGSVGPLERLDLAPAPPLTPKSGAAWRSWAEVRVRHFSAEPASTPLVRVNLRQALTRWPGLPPDSSATVASADGTPLTAYRLPGATHLLFRAKLPPSSEERFQLGFRPGSPRREATALAGYADLLASEANLAPNGSFESGTDAPERWLKPDQGGPLGVHAGFSPDGRFGRRALELTVTSNPQAAWVGWHSGPLPVKPGATYLLSGWLKGLGLQSAAAIHAHFLDAHGALTTSGAMVSTQPTVSGDSSWVNSRGFFRAPPDAATLELHLTMNTQGTLRHDGIVLCEVVDGDIVNVHTAPCPPAAPGLWLWEVNPLVKVFPDTPPQAPARALAVELAGNEYQAFELALRSAADHTTQVSIAVSPLAARRGAALPPVTIERVGYVPIDYPSAYYSTEVPPWCRKVPTGAGATEGWAGWWPDPLAPATNVALAPQQTQPLWFTVHAPKQATPGRYHAQVVISPAAGPAIRIPLTVEVLPFALPDRGQLRAIFDFRFGPGGGFGGGVESMDDYRRWLRFIAAHRLGLNEIHPPPDFTYRDGRVTMDATAFDAMAQFCFDELGINVAYTPQFFYLFGWAYPPKKLFGLEPLTPEWNVALQQAYRLFSDHVRQKGWHDRFVYYIADEPHFQHPFVVEQMKRLCALVHAVDPTIPIYSSTWRHCPPWDDSLDLWGIGQYGCFPVNEMQRLQRAGKALWFTCDGQMATDTPFLATERLLPYYCYKYGVQGFEFWGLAWWTYNPWQIGWHQFIRQSDEGQKYYWVRYPDGDGFLTYPGKPVGLDGPASTIRLEQIRQGLQDYEALQLLAARAARAARTGRPSPAAERALARARELVVIPNAGGLRSTEILPDPGRVPAVRNAVNAALVELLARAPAAPSSAP